MAGVSPVEKALRLKLRFSRLRRGRGRKGFPAFPKQIAKELSMNKDQVKGTLRDISGKIQEETGKLVGNTGQQLKGLKNQAKGKVQKGVGDLKQAVSDVKDAAKR